MLYALNKVQPNQTVQFEVLRDDKTRNISATLATAPDETPATGNQASASKGPVLGMSIRDLAVPEKNALGIKGGIYVQDVRRGGLASLSNIIPGDVIIQVNNTQILNSQDFAKLFRICRKYSCASWDYSSRTTSNAWFTYSVKYYKMNHPENGWFLLFVFGIMFDLAN